MVDLVRCESSGGLLSLRQAMDQLFEDSSARTSRLLPELAGEEPVLDVYQMDKDVVMSSPVSPLPELPHTERLHFHKLFLQIHHQILALRYRWHCRQSSALRILETPAPSFHPAQHRDLASVPGV